MTHISEDIIFRGEIQFGGELNIDGQVEGKINSEGTLLINPSARIKADIHVRQVSIKGNVQGKLEADLITILGGGKVHGDMYCSQLQIERGGTHNGTTIMS